MRRDLTQVMHYLAALVFILFVQMMSVYVRAAEAPIEALDNERARVREHIRSMSEQRNETRPFSVPLAHDLAANLVENGATLLRNLADLEKRGLLEAKLEDSPWGD